MLDQQFFDNPEYSRYLRRHYVLFHVDAAREHAAAVFDEYDVNSTPSVLVAKSDGTEIDRILGFDVSPREYRESLDRIRNGDGTLLALLDSYEAEPRSLRLAATLAKKYRERFAFSKMLAFSRIVLDRAAEAEHIMIPLDDDGAEVSAYEFARYTSGYEGPEKVLDFLTEFPESPLREESLENLAWYLANEDNKDSVLAIYETLLERYPHDPGLLAPLIGYYEGESNPEAGIGHAENLLGRHPERFDPSLRRSYASMLLMVGDEQTALEVYGPSFGTDILGSGEYRPLNDYAWFWATRGKNLESALAAAERALAIHDAANIWDTLSMVHRQAGRLEDALAAEERAVKLSEGKVERYRERLEEIRRDISRRRD